LRAPPSNVVGLNEDLIVIAIDLHPKQATIAMVDLNGRLLSRSQVPLTSKPAGSTRLITDCIKRMREAFAGKSIEGIGISLPADSTPVRSAWSLRRICMVRLRSEESNREGDWLGGKDGERCHRMPVGRTPFRTPQWNSRCRACNCLGRRWYRVFANGQVITGNHGMAGEFGHISWTGLESSAHAVAKMLGNGCIVSCSTAVLSGTSARRVGSITFHELLNKAEEGDQLPWRHWLSRLYTSGADWAQLLQAFLRA